LNQEFSVLISVYGRENPSYLDEALGSLMNQTLLPSEIVLVKDGPLGAELEEVIERYLRRGEVAWKVVALEENLGLGEALNRGLKHCSHEWVARMDSDDIAFPQRFQRQFDYLSRHPELDLCGAWICEFHREPGECGDLRQVPEEHEEIVRFAAARNPVNHVTVLFRKSAVEKAGGYRHFPGFEDYALWVRMILGGARLGNLPEVLVAVRTGEEMIRRRRGWEYVRREWRFQRWMGEVGFLGSAAVLRNLALRIPPRLLPGFLVQKVYSILRKQRKGCNESATKE